MSSPHSVTRERLVTWCHNFSYATHPFQLTARQLGRKGSQINFDFNIYLYKFTFSLESVQH